MLNDPTTLLAWFKQIIGKLFQWLIKPRDNYFILLLSLNLRANSYFYI